MKMTYGKFKGQEIEDIPTSYIVWMLENTSPTADIQKEMENQLAARRGEGIDRGKNY